MIINKSDEMRREILKMTQELSGSQEANRKMSSCVEKHLVAPMDNEKLILAAENISELLPVSKEKILPLLILSPAIGIDSKSVPQFLVEMSSNISVYHSEDFLADPYYRKIDFSKIPADIFSDLQVDLPDRSESLEYKDITLKRGEFFFDKEPASDGYQRIKRLGIFEDKDFSYPAFFDNGKCLRSVSPDEILNLKENIDQAQGHVLALGLGLGYYAYMSHLKDDVASVTIVEPNHNFVQIFEKYILPQFEYPEKIHVIEADAQDYLNKLEDGKFDSCFADLWRNPEDGLKDYLKIKSIGNSFSRTRMSYRIEESFVSCLESFLANVVQYAFLGEDDSQMMSKPGYEIMKKLTADVSMQLPEEIARMFGGKYVRDLLKSC